MTASLALLCFFRSSCGGYASFAPLQLERSQLSSFGLLENCWSFYVDILPKMIFRSPSAYFISDHSLALENFHSDAMKFAVVLFRIRLRRKTNC